MTKALLCLLSLVVLAGHAAIVGAAESTAAALGKADVRTTTGASLAGVVTALDAEQLTIAVDGKSQSIAIRELLAVSFSAAEAKPATAATVFVELVDGSLLNGAGLRVARSANATAVLTVAAEQTVELPIKAIRSIRFGSSAEASRQWTDAVQGKLTADLIGVRKKDSIDFLEGVIGAVDADTVQFQLDGDTIPVKRAKVEGLIYFHRAENELPDPSAVVTDVRGWRLNVKSLSLQGNLVHLVTTSGAAIDRPVDQLVKIDFSAGKLTYVSDLTAESVEWSPLLNFGKSAAALKQFYRPRQNEAQEGPLRLGGKAVAKGLQLYPRTVITYRLPAKSRQLLATVGIDDAVRPRGKVTLQVFGDDKSLYETKLSGSDVPKLLDVKLDGIRRLKLIVDVDGNLDIGNHLDLCEARILK